MYLLVSYLIAKQSPLMYATYFGSIYLRMEKCACTIAARSTPPVSSLPWILPLSAQKCLNSCHSLKAVTKFQGMKCNCRDQLLKSKIEISVFMSSNFGLLENEFQNHIPFNRIKSYVKYD